MKKILLVAVAIIVGFSGAYYLFTNEDELSESQIREKFGCERITHDVQATDIYCRNPGYYIEDVESDSVIGASDFDDPRYKAFYEKPAKSTYGYNPYYANAIQQQKPELCENIEYALISGPTDAFQKVTGPSAINTCRQQAEAGFFGCECDSESVLNAMRIKN